MYCIIKGMYLLEMRCERVWQDGEGVGLKSEDGVVRWTDLNLNEDFQIMTAFSIFIIN